MLVSTVFYAKSLNAFDGLGLSFKPLPGVRGKIIRTPDRLPMSGAGAPENTNVPGRSAPCGLAPWHRRCVLQRSLLSGYSLRHRRASDRLDRRTLGAMIAIDKRVYLPDYANGTHSHNTAHKTRMTRVSPEKRACSGRTTRTKSTMQMVLLPTLCGRSAQ